MNRSLSRSQANSLLLTVQSVGSVTLGKSFIFQDHRSLPLCSETAHIASAAVKNQSGVKGIRLASGFLELLDLGA